MEAQDEAKPKEQAKAQAAGRRARFYDRVLTQEEIELVSGMAANQSLDDEIALLRVSIRRKLEEGSDIATISKAVDALARVLKVHKQISVEGHQALQDALLAVLAELGSPDEKEKGEKPRRQQRTDTVVR